MSGRWTLGPTFVLRHAGFPFDWLESLGVSEEFLARVSGLLEAEQALIDEALRAGGEKAAARAREDVERGRPPQASRSPGAAWTERVATWRTARAAVEEEYPLQKVRLRNRLHELAREPDVQEAVFLSSPDMFSNVWARYVGAEPGPENADVRRVERQVYSYLQRFCAKSETTSFFGPMGYGELEGDGTVEVKVLPGPRRRRTFLAFWAVQELAKAIGREKAFGPHLPLRKNPIFRFEQDRVHCASLELEVKLGSDEARVVAALDRAGSLAELAAALGTDVATATRLVLPLLKVAAVVRGLSFPTEDLEVFEHLRAAVAALPESEARSRWLTHLERLDALRAEFERGTLDTRRSVLPRLEALFTELTGVPARRGEGRMYTDRLVIYEEAASPFQLRFGRQYAQRLAEALSPALELSAAFGTRVQQGYAREIRGRLGEGTQLDFLGYAAKLRPDVVSGSKFAPVEPVLLPGLTGREASVPADLLGTTSGGRFSLPDVCLEAKPDGTFDVLLARVHHHLLVWNWLCAFYPDRPRMEHVARRWLEHEPSAAPLVALALTRRNKGFYCFPGPKVAYTTAEALALGPGDLSAADLTVMVGADGPVLRDRDGHHRLLYLPLADFSTYPPFAALAHPLVLHAPLRTGTAHVPRIRIGAAAYQRERWEVDLSSLEKLAGLDLFLAVRREALTQGWPRFLFGRTAQERKPFLLDTASPFSHELLRHLVRGSGTVSFEEMLPSPEGLFLKDARGRYTFELRMQSERWREGAAPPAQETSTEPRLAGQ
jgi:hypothetical protein